MNDIMYLLDAVDSVSHKINYIDKIWSNVDSLKDKIDFDEKNTEIFYNKFSEILTIFGKLQFG